jgi:hypothetical protein
MSLIRSTPRKRIRAAEAAKMANCHPSTIRRLIEERVLDGKKLTNKERSPWMVFEAQVKRYFGL